MRTQPTIPDHIRNVALSHGDQLALRDRSGVVSYRDLGIQMERTGRALRGSGLGPGDRVGLALDPSVPYVVLILGAMAAGLVPVPLNTRLTATETERFLAPIGVDLLVAAHPHAEFAAALGQETILLRDVQSAGTIRDRLDPLHGPESPDPVAIDPDAPALILPTGGTSGAPKGVWFDHGALWRSVAASALNMPRQPDDHDLYFAPFFHIMFPSQLLYALFQGGSVEIMEKFDADEALAAIRRGATRFGGAPTLLTRLRQHPDFDATPRGHVSRLLFGAAPATPEFIEQLVEDYPNASLTSLYGATEYGGPVCWIQDREIRGGCFEGVGRPWPGQRVTILDDEGRPCSPGELGYFSVRSMGQANGYWGRPEETERTFRPDGVRVGDLGAVDENGHFSIIGRDSEMIITGGENVFPTEVERALSVHPDVSDVLVFGVPDETWGHRVEALVVPEAGDEPGSEDLRTFLRKDLAGYKIPKAIHFVDGIPITVNNKPDRRAAAALAKARAPDNESVE